ncbi:MAG: GTP-binding protein [Muribaculum sp.]|nr:GTP-binding protein [Muribaculum sp.]
MTDTPVLLLTGYLGSGKTTLLNYILKNEKGIKFAVIVNDIGEVNIDASLIQKGGVVGQDSNSDDLVALQNGCICCTLRTDLMKQIADIIDAGKFDYIVIEASGVCEPEPIAQTICQMEQMVNPTQANAGRPRLDCIVTVADALRLKSEFGCGDSLTAAHLDEEAIENLIVQQLEFCNIVLLNKISEVTRKEANRIRDVIKALNPSVRIIECDYAKVPLEDLINTGDFNFGRVATGATWVREIERDVDPEEEDKKHHHHESENHEDHHDHHDHHHDEHGHHDNEGHHHHHNDHHHHDGEGEAEEYGIGTYVYFRRRPFDLNKFDRWVNLHWPKNIIRTKGVMYFSNNRDMSLLFEQAGVQKTLQQAGLWYATAPKKELEQFLAADAQLRHDWDPEYGDRMIKLVFIGRELDREKLASELDSCLAEN